MTIIHVKGTQCSGKSCTIAPFRDDPDIAVFDVLDFYKKKGAIKADNTMDWDIWETIKYEVAYALDTFLDSNAGKLRIVESGSNLVVNQTLIQRPESITTLELKTPDDTVLKARAKEVGLKEDRVIDFKQMYLRRHADREENAYTTEAAQEVIRSQLEKLKEAKREED
jgi:hypothetical protein